MMTITIVKMAFVVVILLIDEDSMRVGVLFNQQHHDNERHFHDRDRHHAKCRIYFADTGIFRLRAPIEAKGVPVESRYRYLFNATTVASI